MEHYSYQDKIILRELSNDSRATLEHLAKVAKCSRATVVKKLARLEKELDIKYTLEIDVDKLGPNEHHVLFMKFRKKPKADALIELFKNDRRVHSMYMCEGDYDLIMYVMEKDPIEYIKCETRIGSALSDFGTDINNSCFVLASFGYMPFTDVFVDDIDEGIKITETDKKILKMLNQNSRIGYSEISGAIGSNDDTVRYRVFRLQKLGIIRRFTIAIQKPPQNYILSFFANYTFHKASKDRERVITSTYMASEQELPLVGKYQLLAPTSGSFRFFALALFNDKAEAEEEGLGTQKRTFSKDGVTLVSARITKVIKGLLPFRNLDIANNYTKIEWE